MTKERDEALKALLMANMGMMCQQGDRWDDRRAFVLQVSFLNQDEQIQTVASVTPATYLALVDEFDLRPMFEAAFRGEES